MNRNQRRKAHDAKRSGGLEPLSEADLAQAKDWWGPEDSGLDLAPHGDCDRRAAEPQDQADQRRLARGAH